MWARVIQPGAGSGVQGNRRSDYELQTLVFSWAWNVLAEEIEWAVWLHSAHPCFFPIASCKITSLALTRREHSEQLLALTCQASNAVQKKHGRRVLAAAPMVTLPDDVREGVKAAKAPRMQKVYWQSFCQLNWGGGRRNGVTKSRHLQLLWEQATRRASALGQQDTSHRRSELLTLLTVVCDHQGQGKRESKSQTVFLGLPCQIRVFRLL